MSVEYLSFRNGDKSIEFSDCSDPGLVSALIELENYDDRIGWYLDTEEAIKVRDWLSEVVERATGKAREKAELEEQIVRLTAELETSRRFHSEIARPLNEQNAAAKARIIELEAQLTEEKAKNRELIKLNGRRFDEKERLLDALRMVAIELHVQKHYPATGVRWEACEDCARLRALLPEYAEDLAPKGQADDPRMSLKEAVADLGAELGMLTNAMPTRKVEGVWAAFRKIEALASEGGAND